jgi:hypothetical protein
MKCTPVKDEIDVFSGCSDGCYMTTAISQIRNRKLGRCVFQDVKRQSSEPIG